MKKLFLMALVLGGGYVFAQEALTPLQLKKAMTERPLGNPQAKVVVVEYASLTCPHCAEFQKETFPLIKKEYIDTGKILYIMRDFPLDGVALRAAQFLRIVPPAGFEGVLSYLFSKQAQWAVSGDPKILAQKFALVGQFAGVPKATIEKALASQPLSTFILTERLNASKGNITLPKAPKGLSAEDKTVRATPTFFINGQRLEGAQPIEAFRKALDKALG